jgi:hypothetical protein
VSGCQMRCRHLGNYTSKPPKSRLAGLPDISVLGLTFPVSALIRTYEPNKSATRPRLVRTRRFLLQLEPEDGGTRGEDSYDLQRQHTQRLSRTFR